MLQPASTPDRSRNFYTSEDFYERSFFDAFADAFTPPEDLPLYKPDYGLTARIRDGQHIREDFHKAVAHIKKELGNEWGTVFEFPHSRSLTPRELE